MRRKRWSDRQGDAHARERDRARQVVLSNLIGAEHLAPDGDRRVGRDFDGRLARGGVCPVSHRDSDPFTRNGRTSD